MEHTRLGLLAQIVGRPAQHLAVLIARRGLVVAEGHDALSAWDLEPGVAAVEEPAEGGGLGPGVHLAAEVDPGRGVLLWGLEGGDAAVVGLFPGKKENRC